MVGVERKNRCKVNAAYSKLLKVGQALGYPAQVAAVKVIEARLGKVAPRAELAVILKIAPAAKTVGHDLVPYGVAYPFGRREHVGRVQPRKLGRF